MEERQVPRWTVRIRWYEDRKGNEATGNNVRLEMLDCEREYNLYPEDLESANRAWFLFKQGAPAEGARLSSWICWSC